MALKGLRRIALTHDPASSPEAQYFGAGAAPPAGAADPLHDDLPLLAGAAAPPPALHELFPPDADGSVAPLPPALPPPQATVEPISIPATADTARAFAMFMTVVSSALVARASLVFRRSRAGPVKRTRRG
jgi:hypothetical protein